MDEANFRSIMLWVGRQKKSRLRGCVVGSCSINKKIVNGKFSRSILFFSWKLFIENSSTFKSSLDYCKEEIFFFFQQEWNFTKWKYAWRLMWGEENFKTISWNLLLVSKAKTFFLPFQLKIFKRQKLIKLCFVP